MRLSFLALVGSASALPGLVHRRGNSSAIVSGTAEGFASSVTGGGNAAAVTPTTTDELVSYLGDSQARVIILNKEFDFTNTEGTKTSSGCSPWGTADTCQIAINKDGWCSNYQSKAPTVSSITYDAAGVEGITVASDKTLVGEGTKGVLKGKGLRMANGVSNIIIQNIHVTEINPKYVWGGDGITVDGADLIWIDHCKTSLIGRQHIVLGENKSGRVTISNNELDGQTSWSTSCDGYHYWGYYFTGANDKITMKGNYIHHTSGRGPKVGGTGQTLLHAVNNYFGPSTDHNFEVGKGAYILAEGNYFNGVPNPVQTSSEDGSLLVAINSTKCTSAIGRACEANGSAGSGSFTGTASDVLSQFSSADNIVSANTAEEVSSSVPDHAGVGKV